MTLTARSYVELALLSARDPREAARSVMAIASGRLDRTARWQALTLVVVLSAILGEVSAFLVSADGDALMGQMLLSPAVLALIQFAFLVITVHAVYWVGRAAGGQGGFEDAILLVAWMQAVLLGLQAVQVVALILVPPLASLIGLAGIALSLWMLTGFVAELHGFRSMGRVFLAILASAFAIAFGVSVVLALIGVTMPGPG